MCVPAGHGAVQAGVLREGVEPQTPAGQGVGAEAPAGQYEPMGQGAGAAGPPAQKLPWGQAPEHCAFVLPLAVE